MRISRPGAILLGGATLLPFLYMIAFAGFVFSPQMLRTLDSNDAFQRLFLIHIAATLAIMGLIAFYVVYLYRTPHVPADKKALWAVILFMANMFAMPLFWYLYVWKPLRT